MIILTVVIFTVVITILLLGFQAIRTFQQNLVSKLESVTEMLSANAVVPIEFKDQQSGQKILNSLETIPEVISAAIYYEKSNELFVGYTQTPGTPLPTPVPELTSLQPTRVYTYSLGSELHIARKLWYNDEIFGTIYIIATKRALTSQIINYLLFVLGLMVVIFAVAILISARLSKHLTQPILKLSETAEKISDKGDYSIRIEKVNDDEIGTLYDSFNHMLDNISQKNREIHKLNESLEEKVHERTRDLLEAKEHAESADRAKSTFLANMSHEIRTPMNSILGYSRLLGKMVTEPKQKEYLEIVKTSGLNLLSLIDDILDLSKIEAGKMNLVYHPMNPNTLFNEIENIFKIKTKEKNIDFIIRIDSEIPTSLIMDETRLRQILFNVVGNAVKFTHEGYVKLSVHKPPVNHGSSSVNLIFTVEDTGIGIPQDQIKKIFKAFEQQSEQSSKYGGTGLGLTITKRLVEMMGGRISVQSQFRKGSVFTIELPDVEISSLQVNLRTEPVEAADAYDFTGSAVLVVEDNPYNLNLVRTLLENQHIQVTTAINGKDGVEKLMAMDLKPHMVLMDMKTPLMNGYQATATIKNNEQLKHIPVVALTADIMKADREKAEKSGCDGFLSKPIDEEKLFRELLKFLPHTRKKRKYSPHQNPGNSSPSTDITRFEIPRLKLAPDVARELLNQLSRELMEKWQKMEDSMILDEWQVFGKHMTRIGEKFDVNSLVHYGNLFVENVNHLSIVELKKNITFFPQFVEDIKKKIISTE